MTDTKKKLFGLFSFKSKASEDDQPVQRPQVQDKRQAPRKDRPRRPRDPNRARRKADETPLAQDSQTKEAPSGNDDTHIKNSHTPLTDWPPPRFRKDDSLTAKEAVSFVTPGAPVFKGEKRAIPHASSDHYHLYALCEGCGEERSDVGEAYTSAFEVASLSLRAGSKTPSRHPWETLEQPSMAFCYGRRAGENTLNHWVSLSRNPGPQVELRDPDVRPRDVQFESLLDRLRYLEMGFDDYEDQMYKNLYGNLLKDPDRYTRPHRAVSKQITDLIDVLCGRDWIDFSLPQNQIVGKFFASASFTDSESYQPFFHQLVLSSELYHRVYSKNVTEVEREKLVQRLPPRILWDLAVARKWKECIAIEPFSPGQKGRVGFGLRNKRVQVKALRRFARAMKWPNVVKVDDILKAPELQSQKLEDRSSDALSYFSGVILPGVTLPWLVMNTLIDCDAEAGVNALAALTHMHPASGFQYRSTTYWSASSIVGKVLAPTTTQQIAGWIGPCRPAPDLSRIQIARIYQRPIKQSLSPADVLDMDERSDALGPPASSYPVVEYTLPMPEIDPNYLVDSIRIEKLALKPVHNSNTKVNQKVSNSPQVFDAAVQFAVAGESWPLRLSYDVSFISACPCSRGPHPLFFDYTYTSVKVDELLSIRDWGMPSHNHTSTSLSSRNPASQKSVSEKADEENELDRVLVVEAFGVPDNEVLARAWCAHWAHSALVADMELTCLGCAVREAYAACLKVVIIIEKLDLE